MSVRIIRNEKARTTTIWQFFAVAILPLLLAYFGGFSVGKTIKDANKSNVGQTQIDSMQMQIKLLQDSLKGQTQLIEALFVMQKPIQDQVYDFSNELTNVYNTANPEDPNPSRDLMDKIGDFFREREDTLDNHKRLLKDKRVFSPVSEKILFLAEKILDLQEIRLDEENESKKNGVVSAAVSDCNTEKDELKQQISELKLDLKLKDIDIANCNSKSKDNTQTNNNDAVIAQKSKAMAKDIDTEAKMIQSILPTLKSSVLGNNKEKVATIGTKVDNILRVTTAIQNLH